jgi:hypothetical protein
MRWTTWLALAVGLTGCWRRVPVIDEGDPHFAYELPETRGECTEDPGCKANGCGQYCTSAATEDFVSTCEAPAAFEGADCGCVEGTCRWYTVEVLGPDAG